MDFMNDFPGDLMIRFLIAILCSLPAAGAADDFPLFESHTVDSYVGEVCYAVTVADVNGDGRLDIVAVSENSVVWYENPKWHKRDIVRDATDRDNVCIAPFDIDGDSQIDFALGAGWPDHGGSIQWLARGESLEVPWQVHPIVAEPWLHRMRFADVLGVGRSQLVISPLNKSQGMGVRLTAFEIPKNPRTERWLPTILDQSLDRMHNHWHVESAAGGPVGTLTASAEGIHSLRRDGSEWIKTKLAGGNPGATKEEQGAGEIKSGKLPAGRMVIATIEPMHGNQVVVYLETAESAAGSDWKRIVIDDSLKRGHALWAADVDNDGGDELIVGHSDRGEGAIKGPGVYIYKSLDGDGTKWEKHIVDDGGIATEDAIAADLNQDGWIDIVAGGRATHNVKVYFNRGR